MKGTILGVPILSILGSVLGCLYVRNYQILGRSVVSCSPYGFGGVKAEH